MTACVMRPALYIGSLANSNPWAPWRDVCGTIRGKVLGKTIKEQHLGLIEGFYGKPWGFDTRANMLPYLSALQYSFYLYAPKADPFLRERWREPVPGALLAKLKSFGQQCKNEGIAWGVGLSPFELHLDFGRKQQDDLLAKLEQLHELDCDWLAILFD